MRPDKQRQPVPGHARRAHRVNRDDEIQAREDRGKPVDENSHAGGNYVRVRKRRAVGNIEGPAGIDAACEQRIDRDDPAEHVDVPAQQVDPRKGQVLRADHHRHQKVSQRGGDRRDQEEKDHDDPVLGEHLVVGARLHEIALRSEQFDANGHRIEAADEKEEADRAEIKQRDALMVFSQQPRLQAVFGVEIVSARRFWYFEFFHKLTSDLLTSTLTHFGVALGFAVAVGLAAGG